MEIELLTIQELSKAFKLGLTATYRLVRESKKFPKIWIGRKLRIPVRHLQIWVDEHLRY
jgi:hypothetical protein